MGKRRLVYSVVLVLLSIAFFQPTQFGAKGLLWSSPNIVEHYAGLDVLSNALQASDGTLWLAWQSNRYAGNTSRYDILYKTWTAGNPSPTLNFTTSRMNAAPALAQLSNGTIILFWSSNPAGNTCSPQCNLYYKRHTPLTQSWSASSQLSSGLFNDSQSGSAVARDGTLWLVWTRWVTNCSVNPCSVTKQLYQRTLKNNAWSPEVQLTSDANWNFGSSVVVGKDGIVRVAWSKGARGADAGQIYYKNYNGTAWSSETQIVTSSTSDEHPSLIQDRNGTLWVFWARKVYYTTLDYHYVVFNKSSYDNGKTWSPESPMTNNANSVENEMPSAVQGSYPSYGPPIWVFYSSNLLYRDVNIYYLMSAGVYPVDDVTVSSIAASPGPGSSWTITVKVVNLGDYPETVSVNLTLSNKTSYNLGPQTGSVPVAGSTSIIFTWNSMGAPVGLYSATASVSPVAGETLGNQGDNNLRVSNLIQLVPPPAILLGGGGAGHSFRT